MGIFSLFDNKGINVTNGNELTSAINTPYIDSFKDLGVSKSMFDNLNKGEQLGIYASGQNLGLNGIGGAIDYNTASSAYGDTLLGGDGLAGKFSGINWMDAGKLGLGVMDYLQKGDMLKMEKRKLENDLKNSQLTRDKLYVDAKQDAGTRGGLAAAFGMSNAPYKENLGMYKNYASDKVV